ncbi:MAG: hypothetical protein ACI8YQ_001876 [Polaribacter sp.]|jgi:hypothetical protein
MLGTQDPGGVEPIFTPSSSSMLEKKTIGTYYVRKTLEESNLYSPRVATRGSQKDSKRAAPK